MDYHYGKEAASEYVIGTRASIANRSPIIGKYGVNFRGSDLYSKGANILHTLRQIARDDEKWRSILRGLNKEFYHKTVTTAQVENYISNKMQYDLSSFFDQYLRDFRIPTLEYYYKNGDLNCRWINVIDNFKMPIEIIIGDKKVFLEIDNSYKKIPSSVDKIRIDPNYYVFLKKIEGV